jgi:histidinol phosphatase-like enzyme
MCILWGHSVRRGGCPYARPRTILFLRYLRQTGIESSDSARTVAVDFGIRVQTANPPFRTLAVNYR